MKVKRVLPLLLVCMFLIGCGQSFIKDASSALTMSKEAYDSTLSTAGDLYRQGIISDDVRKEAIKIGKVYQFAHNEAVNALAQYKVDKSKTSKDLVTSTIANVSKSLNNLIQFLKPYIVKEVSNER